MKNPKTIFAVLVIAFSIASCKKSEEYQNISLSQTLTQNQSYTFVLPSTDDPYTIVKEAEHAQISIVGKDSTGNIIYSYTPAANYSGNDQIVLQTTHEDNHGDKREKGRHSSSNNNKNQGVCGNDLMETEDDYIVTINIQILPLAQQM